MACKDRKLAIDTQDHQHTLAEAAVSISSVYHWLDEASPNIEPQIEAVIIAFCIMLFYYTYDIEFTPQYTLLNIIISTMQIHFRKGG